MLFKLLTVSLSILLTAETLFILMHRHPTNRFKPVEGYEGVVAFDTATGQLCKTLRTVSVTEIQRSAPDEAQKSAPCPPLSPPSGDSILDEIRQAGVSKSCRGQGQSLRQESEADSTLEFVVKLPTCASIQ